MPEAYTNEIIACAAVLIAAVILNALPRDVRRALFVVIFATGALAALASFGNAVGLEAVSRLFG